MDTRRPALFLSHGSPLLALTATPSHRFLAGLGKALGEPRAIVVVSAHWIERDLAVSIATAPETIHDFHGFPRELYALRYPAPGDPALGERIAAGLEAAIGRPVARTVRGLDHGAWVPLLLMYPRARIPVLQVAMPAAADATAMAALGAALAPLRNEDVLLIGSGSLTHSLREVVPGAPPDTAPDWVSRFADWTRARIAAGDDTALLDWARQAPEARRNHPTAEHFLPLHFALGAARPRRATALHTGYEHATLAMDAWRFD